MSDSLINSKPLKSLTDRPGDYDSFQKLMQQFAQQYEIPDGPFVGQNPFENVDLESGESFLNGIFKSWSAVLEVLSFYQERIINEGYLLTAREKFSVNQLVSAIAYNKEPVLSAQTWLAFTLIEKSTSTQYVIPAGSQAQNIPDAGKPAVFETLHDFIGRPSWNKISLYYESIHQNSGLRTSSIYCLVQPVMPLPKKKSHLLISGQLAGEELIFFVEINEVIKQKTGSLLLSWDKPLMEGESLLLDDLQIKYVPNQYSAFGFDSNPWSKVPLKDKERLLPSRGGILAGYKNSIYWTAQTSLPPSMDIQGLVSFGEGSLGSVGNDGFYYSKDHGLSWEKSTAKEVNRKIFCITKSEDGGTYVGCSGGAVFYSPDQGKNWSSIRGKKPINKKDMEDITPGMLPAVNINSLTSALVVYENNHERTVILAGTSNGLFYTIDNGSYWHDATDLFSYHEDKMPKGLLIHEVRTDGTVISASTSKGLYFAIIDEDTFHESENEIKKLKPSLIHRLFHSVSPKEEFFIHKNEKTEVFCSLSIGEGDTQIILLSSEYGVYRLQNGAWVLENNGLINDLEGNRPKFTKFIEVDGIIYGASERGVYVSKDRGINWEVQVNEFVVSLANLDDWVGSFNAGQIPKGFTEVLLLRGYYFTEKTELEIIDEENWTLVDSSSQIVTVSKAENGLLFNFLNDDGEVASELNLYNQDSYSSLLIDGALLAQLWTDLLSLHNIQLSESTYISWNESQQFWTIQDFIKDVTLVVNVDVGKLNVFRIDNVLSLISINEEQFFAGTTASKRDLNEWPEFEFNSDIIDISKNTDASSLGQQVFLRQEEPWEVEQLYEITGTKTSVVKNFGKTARVTALQLSTNELRKFHRRNVKVYTGIQALKPFESSHTLHAPNETNRFKLAGQIATMESGQNVSFEGRVATIQFIKFFTDATDICLKGTYKNGRVVELKRPFIFTTKADKISGDLEQGILSLDLLKVLEKKEIFLTSTALLYQHLESRWSIIQENAPAYFLELNKEDNTLDVYREYYYPVLNYSDKDIHILYQGELLTVQNNKETQYDWVSADESIPMKSEIVRLVSFSKDGFGHINVELESPLKNLYDPKTILIRANLVKSVQSESVRKQVIGSAVQSVPFQTFKLIRKPLTNLEDDSCLIKNFLKVYIRRSLPWGATESTLEEWKQLESLNDAAPHEKCFALSEDSQGFPVITFGDGQHGQIPPGGAENILVDYRYGGGSSGNLAAGEVKVLRSKPRGIKKVVNPVAASGGADGIPITDIRKDAPSSVQNSGVIISLQDYVYFSENFPGVSKVQVQEFDQIPQKIMLVNILAEPQINDIGLPGLVSDLENALKAYSTNEMPLKVLLAVPVLFKVVVKIYTINDQSFIDIKNEVIKALSLKYSLANSRPGKAIENSDLIATVQKVNGIGGVELKVLSYVNNPELNFSDSKLTAFPAFLEASGEFRGAQVLSISKDHIDIELGVRV